VLRCATSELGPRGDSQLSTVSLIVNELQPSLFRGLERSDIDFVVSAAVRRKCQRGAVLCTEGEVADQLFMLLSGRARYFTLSEDGRRVILRWILPGDIFGGMSLMHDPEAYLVNTESVRDSEFLAWSRMDIRRIALRHPRMLENALTMASDYLKWYITAHLALTSQSAPQRLARVLFNLTKDSGLPVEGGIGLDITNEELADAAHITRFSTSRLLGEWQRKGLLVKHRGKLVVTSPERLLGHVPQRHATAI
jgi:CRP/FNR family transcriptional regulator, nitrogen oxide reductase regulator